MNRIALAFSIAVSLLIIGIAVELKASDWASWVQAVGSIGAIVGAWLGIQSQLRANAEEKTAALRAAEFSRAQAVRRLTLDVANACRKISHHYREAAGATRKVDRLLMLAEISALAEFIQKVEAHSAERMVVADALRTASACANATMSLVEQLAGELDLPSVQRNLLSRKTNEWHEDLQDRRALLTRYMSASFGELAVDAGLGPSTVVDEWSH